MTQNAARLRHFRRHTAPRPNELLAMTGLVTELMQFINPGQLVDAWTLRLPEVLCCDAALTWLYNSVSHRYVLSALTASGQLWTHEERDALQVLQIRSGEALAGRVVSEAAPQRLASADAYRGAFGALGRRREGLYNRLRTILPDQFSVLALPLISPGTPRPLGVIELFSTRGTIVRQDAQWLRSYTEQLAELLKLAQMQVEARKQRQRLSALDSVVTAIATASDLPELLQMALLVMIEVIGATGGAICTTAPGDQALLLEAQFQVPPDELPLLNSNQATLLLADVIAFSQPSLRPALQPSDPEAMLLGRAAVPLLAGGTVVGVLLLYGQLELLGDLDWGALVSVCSQIGIAIANTRLYEESQRERHRLNTVIDSIADGVAIGNDQGELILANHAAAELLDLASLPTTAHASSARDLQGEPLESAMLPLARALHGEVFRDYRIIMRGAQNSDRVLSFSGAPLRGSALDPQTDSLPNGAVVVFRDITAQRRLDEAKDEFLAVAAHELRSPLAAIKGYSDLLLRREVKKNLPESRDLRGHQILNQQVNVLVQLVDNVLDISRIDAGRFMLQPSLVDLNSLVEAVAIQIRTTAHQHTLTTELLSEPARVWGDELRLRQVITNLLTNAVRYSPVHTAIWVRITADDTTINLIFDDEGPGIPVQQRDNLFERYYRVPGIKRTGSSTEGLGLGLYLCREIVALHTGTIWVETAPGGGARFQVALPRHQPRPEFEALLASNSEPDEPEDAD